MEIHTFYVRMHAFIFRHFIWFLKQKKNSYYIFLKIKRKKKNITMTTVVSTIVEKENIIDICTNVECCIEEEMETATVTNGGLSSIRLAINTAYLSLKNYLWSTKSKKQSDGQSCAQKTIANVKMLDFGPLEWEQLLAEVNQRIRRLHEENNGKVDDIRRLSVVEEEESGKEVSEGKMFFSLLSTNVNYWKAKALVFEAKSKDMSAKYELLKLKNKTTEEIQC